jgi:hypothetical protein
LITKSQFEMNHFIIHSSLAIPVLRYCLVCWDCTSSWEVGRGTHYTGDVAGSLQIVTSSDEEANSLFNLNMMLKQVSAAAWRSNMTTKLIGLRSSRQLPRSMLGVRTLATKWGAEDNILPVCSVDSAVCA